MLPPGVKHRRDRQQPLDRPRSYASVDRPGLCGRSTRWVPSTLSVRTRRPLPGARFAHTSTDSTFVSIGATAEDRRECQKPRPTRIAIRPARMNAEMAPQKAICPKVQ